MKTKKVVICSGLFDFRLSEKQIDLYIQYSGLKVYKRLLADDYFGKDFEYSSIPFNEFDKIRQHERNNDLLSTESNKHRFRPEDIKRDDPHLVRVVEETIGDVGVIDFDPELRIVEIPEDVEFEMDRYEGCPEIIREVSRTWYYQGD